MYKFHFLIRKGLLALTYAFSFFFCLHSLVSLILLTQYNFRFSFFFLVFSVCAYLTYQQANHFTEIMGEIVKLYDVCPISHLNAVLAPPRNS